MAKTDTIPQKVIIGLYVGDAKGAVQLMFASGDGATLGDRIKAAVARGEFDAVSFAREVGQVLREGELIQIVDSDQPQGNA